MNMNNIIECCIVEEFRCEYMCYSNLYEKSAAKRRQNAHISSSTTTFLCIYSHTPFFNTISINYRNDNIDKLMRLPKHGTLFGRNPKTHEKKNTWPMPIKEYVKTSELLHINKTRNICS